MKKFLAIMFLLCSCKSVMATDVKKSGVDLVDLSFEQAYELMLENNNSLKAHNEAIKQAKFEKNAALGEFSPKVVMNSTYLHFSKDMNLTTSDKIMGMPVSITSHIQDQNLFTFGGGVVWNIFTGGKLLSNHAAARAKYEATNAKYRDIKDNLTVELVKRYYGLRLARDVAEVRRQTAECIEKHVKDARLLEKEGVISKAERLHAEVAYADAERDYRASLRDINIVEESLKTLIKAQDVDLKEVRIEPASLLFVYNETSVDVDAMKANALENNPKLKQLAEKRKIMNAKYHAKVADYMPTVSLFAMDIVAAGNLSETIPRAAIGGSANMLLFDGFSRTNNVRAAKVERKSVDYEIEDARYNIECLVTKQYQELMKYKENYDSAVKSLETAEESLRVANLSFKEGFGTSLQVTDAQMMLLKVKIERLNSIYNYDVTLADLLKTNGDTDEILNYISNSNKANM